MASVNATAIPTRFNIRTSASKDHTPGRSNPASPRARPLTVWYSLADGIRRGGFARRRKFHETAAAPAADLAAFAAGVAGLVRGPLVGGALLVRRASSLASDFPLLLGGHRGKTAAFLTLSVVHHGVLCKFTQVCC